MLTSPHCLLRYKPSRGQFPIFKTLASRWESMILTRNSEVLLRLKTMKKKVTEFQTLQMTVRMRPTCKHPNLA
ncbi:hypothetical protein RHMOL_Rhmol11G0051900 [Rhododendron molle]|uniref:Uncharacterized protein n=1 Tax=Rhododendron molle TaxID=49168 RepID=A0ACC0LQ21_RHOML|nr:hypothetical protein RHMOL_Rhmol11G0051900 [Rhododendron molle]